MKSKNKLSVIEQAEKYNLRTTFSYDIFKIAPVGSDEATLKKLDTLPLDELRTFLLGPLELADLEYDIYEQNKISLDYCKEKHKLPPHILDRLNILFFSNNVLTEDENE